MRDYLYAPYEGEKILLNGTSVNIIGQDSKESCGSVQPIASLVNTVINTEIKKKKSVL